MTLARLVTVGLLALAVAAGAAWWLQGQTTEALRLELGLLHEEQGELKRLQAEKQRLVAAQVPAEELARLRNDHAAVARMRGEIDKLRTEMQAREVALARAPAARQAAAEALAAQSAPALSFRLGLGADGALSADGGAVDLAWLRQRLGGLTPGSSVQIRLQLPKTDRGVIPADGLKRRAEEITVVGRELKLKVSVLIDLPGQE